MEYGLVKVRWRDIEDDPRLASAHPLLRTAVAHVAHYQIRNRGTVGGSLAHADPAAEMPGIAVACDAAIAVVGAAGERVIAAGEFFLGPLATVLGADEIITEIRLPAWFARRRWGFEEFARRRGDFALAGIALYYDETEAPSRGQAIAELLGQFQQADLGSDYLLPLRHRGSSICAKLVACPSLISPTELPQSSD